MGPPSYDRHPPGDAALAPLPAPLAAAADAMRGCPVPWAVAGGWALDLALGAVTRVHGDVDLAAFRADQVALRAHLGVWRWEYISASVPRLWAPGAWLAPPVHELYATSPGGGTRLEVLLNERDGTDWVFRRDHRVRLPLARAVLGARAGLPVLAPEIVLLYKAKAPRPADAADFAAAHPRLDAAARDWLADALARCHPGHPWLRALAAGEP